MKKSVHLLALTGIATASFLVSGCATPYMTKIHTLPGAAGGNDPSKVATLIIPAGVMITTVDGIMVPEWGSSLRPWARKTKTNEIVAVDLDPGEHTFTFYARMMMSNGYKEIGESQKSTFSHVFKAGETSMVYCEDSGGASNFGKMMLGSNTPFFVKKKIGFQLDWYLRKGAEEVLLDELRNTRANGTRIDGVLVSHGEKFTSKLEKALNYYTTLERRKKNYPDSVMVASSRDGKMPLVDEESPAP